MGGLVFFHFALGSKSPPESCVVGTVQPILSTATALIASVHTNKTGELRIRL